MKRYIKKQYGESKVINCPFCNRMATQKNAQGLDVCYLHTKTVQEEIKCACGTWLELRMGKFGPYYFCLKCGNINYAKAMELKMGQGVNLVKTTSVLEKKEPREVIITSRDSEYF